jgi:hypothetical protein
MRTNIVLDDDLVDEALRVFIASKKRKNLLDLRGKIEFAQDYDYKALRQPNS